MTSSGYKAHALAADVLQVGVASNLATQHSSRGPLKAPGLVWAVVSECFRSHQVDIRVSVYAVQSTRQGAREAAGDRPQYSIEIKDGRTVVLRILKYACFHNTPQPTRTARGVVLMVRLTHFEKLAPPLYAYAWALVSMYFSMHHVAPSHILTRFKGVRFWTGWHGAFDASESFHQLIALTRKPQFVKPQPNDEGPG